MKAPESCTPNIGPEQRRRRLFGGLVMLALTLVVAAYFVSTDISPFWRLLLAAPALGAALGLSQARAQTCVALAARGLRNMDDGYRVVTDAAELASIRSQSRRVYITALLAALVLTAVVFIL